MVYPPFLISALKVDEGYRGLLFDQPKIEGRYLHDFLRSRGSLDSVGLIAHDDYVSAHVAKLRIDLVHCGAVVSDFPLVAVELDPEGWAKLRNWDVEIGDVEREVVSFRSCATSVDQRFSVKRFVSSLSQSSGLLFVFSLCVSIRLLVGVIVDFVSDPSAIAAIPSRCVVAIKAFQGLLLAAFRAKALVSAFERIPHRQIIGVTA